MACAICLEHVEHCKHTLTCNHSFHQSCIQAWTAINPVCPICRHPIQHANTNPPKHVVDNFVRRIQHALNNQEIIVDVDQYRDALTRIPRRRRRREVSDPNLDIWF